jgi:hypothetical protein
MNYIEIMEYMRKYRKGLISRTELVFAIWL